jgi:hypothetical protein
MKKATSKSVLVSIFLLKHIIVFEHVRLPPCPVVLWIS